ncbi:MAG: MmpL protein [Mycobacterium sp.]|nr:MmpL protein [Mycobacterium sp.]
MSETGNANGSAPVDDHSRGAIPRLGRAVLRHRRRVMLIWLVIFIAGAAASGSVSNRLKVDFSLPGQPGYEAAKKVQQIYGSGIGQPPTILVITAPAGGSARTDNAKISSAFAQLRKDRPALRIVDAGTSANPDFFSKDGRSEFALLFGPQGKGFSAAPALKDPDKAIARALPAGYKAAVTGLSELQNDSGNGGSGVLVETLLGGLGALAVLAFVFASLLALMPLLVAAVSILTTLLIVLGLTFLADVSFIVQFLVSLIGLGVAIDYSLLLVTRWREERQAGRENADAIVVAMATAGRAVLLSGLTVAVGLVALIVLPVPGLRSVGYGGILIPLVSTAVTLTLLPALLGGIGPRMEWPRRQRAERNGRIWAAWGRGVVRRPKLAAGVALVILAVLIIPVFSLTVGQTSADALSKSGPARTTYEQLIAGGAPEGVLTPLEVLTTSGSSDAAAQKLRGVDGISRVITTATRDTNRGGTSIVIAIPEKGTLNGKTLAPVRDARKALKGDPGVIGITGDGAIALDYSHAVFGSFPLMFAIIAILTFLLLARAFRSIVLAAKALVLNVISLSATFGLMTWFWQEGHGSNAIFGIPATGAITFWVPLMVFAFLFGLSMDYEVFILARMRESYDRTGSTSHAVVEGLARTGRLVTSAALILFLAFASLASAPNTDLKVLATGLGAGILLDATVVRALLLPALVELFGRWNWWLPAWLAKVLRVEPSAAVRPSAVALSLPAEPEPAAR